jgi:hypothetical protein
VHYCRGKAFARKAAKRAKKSKNHFCHRGRSGEKKCSQSRQAYPSAYICSPSRRVPLFTISKVNGRFMYKILEAMDKKEKYKKTTKEKLPQKEKPLKLNMTFEEAMKKF